MTQTADKSTDALRIRMTGMVLTREDADYDHARSVFNGAVDRRPAVIARCANSTVFHLNPNIKPAGWAGVDPCGPRSYRR